MRYIFGAIVAALTLLGGAARAQDPPPPTQPITSYTTVKTIKVTPLSNGIQIAIQADGILQQGSQDGNYVGNSLSGKQLPLFFPQAKNGTGKNFINVNRYPVSHIALSTPQGAVNGIGLNIVIHNLTEAQAQVSNGPDGQSVLVTILSNRTIEGKRPAAAAATVDPNKPDTTTQVSFKDGKVSIRAVRADIHALMALIAEKTGVQGAIDDAVDKKVSINLDGVAPGVAIQAIATANGLALSQVGNLFVLSEGVPTDLATYRVSGTQSYRMQNTQAATASGLLPNFLYSYVKVNPEQNAVVVSAPLQMLAKIGQDLGKVDTPSPQILVEAIAVELTDDALREFGLNLFNQRSTSISVVDPLNGLLSYDTVGKLPQSFILTLRALEKSGRARVRARPQMAVVNGKTANIFIGAQRFILTQFNNFGQTQTRIQPVDVGVKLAVTPLTGGNGEITTTIAPEVSNITEQDPQTGLPVLSTRNAQTTVRVKDGETIVIGGLVLNQEQNINRKIPVLGDLPVLGNLFRTHSRTTTQTELVVFVTPHILVDGKVVGAPATPGTPIPPTPPGKSK